MIQHRDILVNLAGNLHQPSNLRSVYLCYLRSSPPPELAAFDLPEFTNVVGKRDQSTVPTQALHLLNSPFVIEQAEQLGRAIQDAFECDRERVRLAYRQTLQREPSGSEVSQALDLVRSSHAVLNDSQKAWASFCQALLMTNEFRYVD